MTNVTYNTAGQVSGLTLGNGVVESYGYDANRLQMTSQSATKGGNTLMSLTYSYQAIPGGMGAGTTAGNTGQLTGITGSIGGQVETAAYNYDLVGRLAISYQLSNSTLATRRFNYDRWGNRSEVTDPGNGGNQIQAVTLQQSGGVPTNRITSVTSGGSTVNYIYDAAGNVTSDGVHTYVYDAESRIVSMDGGAAQYRYDHQNRRVCKIAGSAWTHYIWEGGQVISEHDATTAYTTNPTYQVNSARVDYVYSGRRMIYNRQRASSAGAWTTRYYLSDRLSERVVMDTSGNVVGRLGHLPFGEDFASSGTQEKHHFTNYERDAESGTDYAINRQYNQNVGRFLSADPYKADADSVKPQNWNRYTYVLNDPISFTDPLGLFPWDLISPGVFCYLFPYLCGSTTLPDIDPETGKGRDPHDSLFPAPPRGECKIKWRVTAGTSLIGKYARNDHFGTPTTIGPLENQIEDGFWGFSFEVQVQLPRDDNDVVNWTPLKWLLKRGEVFVPYKGGLHKVSKDQAFGRDGPGDHVIDLTHPGFIYFYDAPDIQKIARDPGGNPKPIVEGNVVWVFNVEIENRRDSKKKRSSSLILRLSIKEGRPTWTASPGN